MKTRYKFSHRGLDGRLYWQAKMPGDSRVDRVSCSADWFWSEGDFSRDVAGSLVLDAAADDVCSETRQ